MQRQTPTGQPRSSGVFDSPLAPFSPQSAVATTALLSEVISIYRLTDPDIIHGVPSYVISGELSLFEIKYKNYF